MSSYYADLVVPDLDSLEVTQYPSAEETKAALASLTEAASEIGLSDAWSRSALVGLDRGPRLPGATERLGISMAWACHAGAGFRRDYEVDAAIRLPEIEVVRRIAEAAMGRCPVPVRAALDIKATWDYGFEVAYRRRLAYAMGYEASIAAQSLSAFTQHLPAFSVPGVTGLAAAVPAPGSIRAFSICLNLVAYLDRAMAYETKKKETPLTLLGALRDAGAKREFLWDRLQSASDYLELSLPSDGRVALKALLEEARIERELKIHNLTLPHWGSIADSEWYRTPEAK